MGDTVVLYGEHKAAGGVVALESESRSPPAASGD